MPPSTRWCEDKARAAGPKSGRFPLAQARLLDTNLGLLFNLG